MTEPDFRPGQILLTRTPSSNDKGTIGTQPDTYHMLPVATEKRWDKALEQMQSGLRRVRTDLGNMRTAYSAQQARFDQLASFVAQTSSAMQAEIGEIRRSIAAIEALVTPRKKAGLRRRVRGRLNSLRRLLRKPADLSPLVSPSFQPFLEAAVLSPWFTAQHRLILSTPIRPGQLLAFEARAPRDIRSVSMAGTFDNARGGILPVALDLCDAVSNAVLAGGAVVATPLDGSWLLTASFPAVTVHDDMRLYVRLLGLPDCGAWDLQIYEWVTFGRYLGRTNHRGLFGHFN
jgi:hypothetical protein